MQYMLGVNLIYKSIITITTKWLGDKVKIFCLVLTKFWIMKWQRFLKYSG